MNENTAPAGELTDIYIEDVAERLLSAGAHGCVFGVIEFARAIITADRALRASPATGEWLHKIGRMAWDYEAGCMRADDLGPFVAFSDVAHRVLRASHSVGDVEMPVVAYLRATPDGKPVWSEDCVCEDAIWPMEDECGDESLDVSMAMVKQSDAQAALAAKDAEISASEDACRKANLMLIQADKDVAALTAERDALKAARYAYAGEFAPDIDGERDLGSIHANIRALKAERDAAMAASRYETDLCGQALTDLKKMTAERDALRQQLDGHDIDSAHAGKLAFALEFMVLDASANWESSIKVLDAYKAAWEAVNPSPPTFMGEPMPPERRAIFAAMKEKREASRNATEGGELPEHKA